MSIIYSPIGFQFVRLLLSFGHVCTFYTIFTNIVQLLPGFAVTCLFLYRFSPYNVCATLVTSFIGGPA